MEHGELLKNTIIVFLTGLLQRKSVSFVCVIPVNLHRTFRHIVRPLPAFDLGVIYSIMQIVAKAKVVPCIYRYYSVTLKNLSA
jgi:hypothetical protein